MKFQAQTFVFFLKNTWMAFYKKRNIFAESVQRIDKLIYMDIIS